MSFILAHQPASKIIAVRVCCFIVILSHIYHVMEFKLQKNFNMRSVPTVTTKIYVRNALTY